MRTKRIHVNQHRIRDNAKDGGERPVVSVKTYDGNVYGHKVDIVDGKGNIVATVIQEEAADRDKLSCGARCWVETRNCKVIVTNIDNDSHTVIE